MRWRTVPTLEHGASFHHRSSSGTTSQMRQSTTAFGPLCRTQKRLRYHRPGRGIQAGLRRRRALQLWTKPLSAISHAVLLLNRNGPNATFTINLTADLNISGEVHVRDIWNKMDLGTAVENFTTNAFGPHDSRFYRFSAV